MDSKYHNRLLKILRLYRHPGQPGESEAARAAFIRVWNKACPNTTPDFEFDKMIPQPIFNTQRPKTNFQERSYKNAAQQAFERWQTKTFRTIFDSSKIWPYDKDAIYSKDLNSFMVAVHIAYDDFKCAYCHTTLCIPEHWKYTCVKCHQCKQGLNLPRTYILKPKGI